MIAPGAAWPRLKSERPEWSPWLAVVEEAVRETGTATWDGAVPVVDGPARLVPILAGKTLTVDVRAVRELVGRLFRTAARSGSPKLAPLAAVLDGQPDLLKLLAASLCHDLEHVTSVARTFGVDVDALHAVVALVAVPTLQACHRRWASSLAEDWQRAYCPVCGAWPAFAEVRGIERSRCLRCARCGAAWHAHALRCSFCATGDHRDLAVLVPAKDGPQAVVEACRRCLGYMKSFTTLQGCPPGAVMLEDLASVDLDVAALEQGYARPAGAGYPLDVTVVGRA
jgi:FdhE protein